MATKGFFGKLLDTPTVFLMIVGLLLFVAGANGGWSKVDVKIDSTGWRVAIALMGLIVVVVGGLSFWREKEGTDQFSKLTNAKLPTESELRGSTTRGILMHIRFISFLCQRLSEKALRMWTITEYVMPIGMVWAFLTANSFTALFILTTKLLHLTDGVIGEHT